MTARMAVSESKIEHLEKSEENVWKSVAELRNLLHTQGVRLALIFGGINVIVVGVGLLIGFAKIMNALQKVGP